jgi:WD40 repeat protein
LIAQGGAAKTGAKDGGYLMVVYAMEGKTKAVGTVQTSKHGTEDAKGEGPVLQCSMSPDNKLICVTGHGVFKLYRLDDGNFKLIQSSLGKQQPTENYMAHVWLANDRVAVSNSNGDLFIVENNDVTAQIPSPDNLSINAIVQYGKGFVCGGANGILRIYEDDDKELYKLQKSLRIEGNQAASDETFVDHTILNFGLSPSNELLAITTSSAQIFTLNLSSSDILKEEEIKFDYLIAPFHSKQITGLDTCIRKPLVVTCSPDKTIRVWNYMDSTPVISRQFQHEVFSVAVHPSGLHIVAGFLDKLRFMNILGNDIREVKSFAVRNCPEVKFSNGGGYFAAVHGNVINVYSTYTLQQLHALRGHSGKIRCLSWMEDDTRLVSVGMDGAVYEYHIKSEKRIIHNVNKNCNYTGVVTEAKSIFAVGSDNTLREFQEGQLQAEYPTGEYPMTCLVFATSHKMMFCGMGDGSVRAYSMSSLDEVDEYYYAHSEPVYRILLTYDENNLITVAEDGSMCLFEIRDREGGRIKREIKFADDVLIAINDLDEKNSTITDLKAKVAELKADNEYEQKKKELEYNEKLKEQEKNFQVEVKKKSDKVMSLLSHKQLAQQEYEAKISEMELSHKQELSKLEHEYNQRIAASMEQISTLKSEMQEIKKETNSDKEKMAEDHAREIQDIKDDFEERLRTEKQQKDKFKQIRDEVEDKAKEIRRQMEEDRDKEIEEIKDKQNRKLNEVLAELSEIGGKHRIADNNNNVLREQIKAMQVKNEKLTEEKRSQDSHNKELLKEIQTLKNENKEREDTIVDKEKRIFELKKQNQELEKFKFVLDYKITTLTEQIKPSKDEIVKLKKDLKRMDKELEKSQDNNDKLNLTIKDLQLKIEGNKREIAQLNNQIKDAEVFKSRIRADIHEVVQFIQEPLKLKEEVKKLYYKHVNQNITKQEMDYDIQNEYDRQRAYLEKTVESLKKKLIKATETSKAENMRIMHENVVLINEINTLRREVRTLKSKLRDKEDVVRGGRKDFRDDASTGSMSLHNGELTIEEAKREIELQKLEIQNLREQLDAYENENKVASRPISRERLAPMV